MECSQIIKRYNSLKADRTDVEEVWRLLERFVAPLRGRFYMVKEHDAKPDWRRREIYDATAIDAASALAASLQGHLVSPAVRWFDLRYNNPVLNKEDAPNEWIQGAADTVFYELQQSNFNLEVAECFLDLVAFGTTFLVEEWDAAEALLTFSSVPIRECYFELGSKGQLVKFYRKLEWTAIQCVDKFGYDNVPDVVKASYDSDKAVTERFEVCYCVYQRPANEVDEVDTSKPAPATRLPFGFKYVLVPGSELMGEEGGYYEMPAFAVRWRTTAGSDWGHAPGLIILSTIMTLNQWTQAVLEAGEKMLEPPVMTTQRGLIGNLDIRRGGVNVVGDMNDLAPFPVGGDTNMGLIVAEDLRAQIRRAFFEDQLELKDSPAMTATEVNVRYELMQRLLGPTLGRLQSDLLDPLIERTMAILIRGGKIPQPPEGSGEYDAEYLGPLPRAQKSDRASSMLGWAGQIAQMAELKPELMDIPDWDNLFTEVGHLTGVPATAIKSEQQIEAVRAQRAKELQAAQQAQQMQAEGDAMKSVGEGAAALPPGAIEAMQGSIPPRGAR